MYEKFFGLRKSPFLLTPDPDFLFLTPEHREALTGLIYAIVQRKGFAVLTGDAGTGKTMVLRTVLQSIPSDVWQFSLLFNPTLTRSEFLEFLLLEFGIEEPSQSKARQMARLQQFLCDLNSRGQIAALLIDEAHTVSPELLEEVRLLTNFETASSKLLQIVLAGQNELEQTLERPSLRQLKQRIALRFKLHPLSPAQVGSYLRFRWRQAGGGEELPFEEDTIGCLATFSACIPRTLNTICDSALLLAFAQDSQRVRPEHIAVVARDLELSAPDRARTPVSTAIEWPDGETWNVGDVQRMLRSALKMSQAAPSGKPERGSGPQFKTG